MTSFLSRVGAPLAVASMSLACTDQPFGPTLTDRWGGTGAELDATQTPPTLQLNCGVTVRFDAAIPMTPAGQFTVPGHEQGSTFIVTQPVTVSGRLTGPDMVLTLALPSAPAAIPPAQFLLHRGRNGDFPSDVVCAQ